jgi:hypothetical protein
MFRRNFLVNCVGYRRLAPVDGRNWENRLNRGDCGENLSAKGCLPFNYLTIQIKIPLIDYHKKIIINKTLFLITELKIKIDRYVGRRKDKE